jgi:hypothetical protein
MYTTQRDLFYVTVRDLREEVRQVLLQYHRKLNNFVMWAEEETKKSAQRHISPAQLQSTPPCMRTTAHAHTHTRTHAHTHTRTHAHTHTRTDKNVWNAELQVESAVEALTDLLSILLDLLRLIPPIPDKYATASKAGQSSDEVAVRRTQQPIDSFGGGVDIFYGRLTWRTRTRTTAHARHAHGASGCAVGVSAEEQHDGGDEKQRQQQGHQGRRPQADPQTGNRRVDRGMSIHPFRSPCEIIY